MLVRAQGSPWSANEECPAQHQSACEQRRRPRNSLLGVESDDIVAHVLRGHEHTACMEVARRVLKQQFCVLALLRSRSGQRSDPSGERDGPSSRGPSIAAPRDPPWPADAPAQSQVSTAAARLSMAKRSAWRAARGVSAERRLFL